MRIKSWKLFENNLDTSYQEVTYSEFEDFSVDHNRQSFSNHEFEVIKDMFRSGIDLSNSADPVVGQLFIFYSTGRGQKAISIYKLDDDWFSVIYINRPFNHVKYWTCDQFNGLIDCLEMIKNKDIDFK